MTRLGDVCEKITDGTHHSPPNHASGEFKYVTAKNIKPWGLDLRDISYIDAQTHREIYSRCDVRKDDVLYVKDGATTGRVALNTLEEEFSLLSSVAVLRPGAALRPKYLMYALQEKSVLDRMLSGVAGVAITRLTLQKLNDAKIPMAPVAAQDRIVDKLEELLSDLDAGVAELKAAQKKLAQYRQSLLKAAVEGRLTEAWRAQHGEPDESGAQLLARILRERRARWEAKQLAKFEAQGKVPSKGWQTKYPNPVVLDARELKELPPGWVWASLDMLSEIQGGIQKQPSRAPVLNKYPFLRVANVARAELRLEDVHEIELLPGELERLALQRGDVLIVEGNGSLTEIGRCALWDGSIENTVHQNHLIRARPLSMSSEFLAAWLNSLGAIDILTRLAATTSGLYTLSVGKLSKVPVPLPPADEQAAAVSMLVEALEELARQDAAIKVALRQSAAQRKNILQAAFSGQLIPQDPNDEPTSVLLARIRAERSAPGATKIRRARPARKSA